MGSARPMPLDDYMIDDLLAWYVNDAVQATSFRSLVIPYR